MKPAIWRRVELPVTNSLKTLHLAIQACMLFENYHLFRFDVGDAAYGIRFDDDDAFMVRTRDAANMRIGKLVERGITSFTYTYDFGDNWRHRIEIEERSEEHTSELQSLMRISYAVFCLKKKNTT